MRTHTLLYGMSLLCSVLVAGCDEETAPDEGHHPHEARLFIGGVEQTPDIVLTAAANVTIEIRFFDDAGDEITGIEADHFGSLTFNPAGLATVSDVVGHHFQKDLVVGAAGTGTVTVGYGHDAAADDESFGPFDVTVQ